MQFLLKFSLFGLGLSAILIGVSFFVFGSTNTANFFASLVAAISNTVPFLNGFDNLNIDGEFRFYSVFWVAYGGLLIHTCQNLKAYLKWVPALALLFSQVE